MLIMKEGIDKIENNTNIQIRYFTNLKYKETPRPNSSITDV